MVIFVTASTVQVLVDPSQPPFDGGDDTLVGVVNASGATLESLSISSNSDIFGFDGDGICNATYGTWSGSAGCPYGPTGYEGPGTSFSNVSNFDQAGDVIFTSGVASGGAAYFSLESPISASGLQSGPTTYVALGDSYSSGQGAPPYYNQTCLQSYGAWPYRMQADVANLTIDKDSFLACSGHTSAQVTTFQLPELRSWVTQHHASPNLTTVTAGGDDLKFSTVLKSCVIGGFVNGSTACDVALNAVIIALTTFRSSFVKRLATLYSQIAAAAPATDVEVVGYPMIMPPPTSLSAIFHANLHCGWLRGADALALFYEAELDLDDALAAAAAQAHVGFISILNSLKGHELCTADSWINDLGLATGHGHPTQQGQDAMAAAVAAQLPTPIGSGAAPALAPTDRADSPGVSQPGLAAASPLQIASATLDGGVVGVPYEEFLDASGGTAPYNWAVTQGTLPAGLVLDPTTGIISGTPTAVGTSNFTIQAVDSKSPTPNQVTGNLSITVAAPTSPTITTVTLPAGTVGQTYAMNLGATGGLNPDSWSLASGTLPAGLTIDPSGAISGTPTTPGTATFTVQATDSSTPTPQTTTKSLTLTIVAAGSALIVTSSSLANANQGDYYSSTLTTTGGTAPVLWSITSGSLPAGLSFDAATGVVSGIPTSTGNSSFVAQATDRSSSPRTASVNLTLSVAAGSPPTILTTSMPAATQGVALNFTTNAVGGVAPYFWSVSSGALPPGLLLDPSTGSIFGNPDQSGTFHGTIALTDSSTPSPQTTSVAFAITVARSRLAIGGTALPAATQGEFYDAALTAQLGVTPYAWSLVNGALPNGLSLDPASGAITGVPTSAGSSTFTEQVTDSSQPSQSASSLQTLTVNPVPPLTITTTSLSPVFAKSQIRSLIGFVGGAAPYQWSITQGALPAGVTLDSTNGVITGSTAKTGSFPVTISVSDSSTPSPQTASAALTLTVKKAPRLGITTSALPDATQGVPYGQSILALGGTAPYTWSVTAGALPAGITLQAASGTISGTPTGNGTFSFTATATDSSSTPKTSSVALSIVVNSASQLTIANSSLDTATQGTTYFQQLDAAGGVTPYTWTVANGSLPSGLILDPNRGSISGAPTGFGTSTFVVSVTDNAGPSPQVATASLSITVEADAAPSVATTTLVAAVRGQFYSTNLAATGGASPYSWSTTSGSLPAGLSLDSSGLISGTPTATGTASFTVQVVDSSTPSPQKASKTLTLLVRGVGSISGTVTNMSGTPLPGICVYAWPTTAGAFGNATTAADGTYTITGLVAASYDVEFTTGCGSIGSYITQWYNNVTTQAAATAVSVSAGKTKTGVNAALQTFGSISGKVTDASTAAAVSGICAYATSTSSGQVLGNAITAADGTYTITGLVGASYDVEFSTGCGSTGNYVTQWYNNVTTQAAATAVTVSSGTATTGIDDALHTLGAISGTVTDASTAAGISGICVYATSTSSGQVLGSTSTAGGGTYTITGLGAASYDVEFTPGCGSSGNYVTQWYDNVTTQAAATAVTVSFGTTTTGIDDALHTLGAISGTVTDAATGTGLSGICVYASSTSGNSSGNTTTAADGTYTITGLAASTYDVDFTPGCGSTGNYVTQWYDNVTTQAAATAVTVSFGTTTTGIDDALQAAASISGKVTDASTGTALSGICVYANSTDGQFFASAETAADGTYTMTNVTPASYDVGFSTGCGSTGNYAPQWYDNVATEADATAVNVAAGSAITGINDALQPGASIAGTVTDAATAAPVSGICVFGFSSSGALVGNSITGADGTYTMADLSADSYQVEYTTGCGSTGNYITQWYDNVISQSDATAVNVATGASITGIDDALQAGASISGKVTAATTAAALPGICVSATTTDGQFFGNATTAADGTYTMTNLTPGSYDVEFSPGCGSTGNYTTQWYKNVIRQSAATAVTVAAGANVAAINDALKPGASISGKVTDAAATALVGICVSATSTDGQFFSNATTAADGTYTMTNLSPGSYDVEFSPGCGSTGNYATQWYDNVTTQAAATAVNVAAGSSITGIDDALQPGASISGKVTDAAAAVPGICVSVTSTDNQFFGFATTAANGTYTVPGLDAASYIVEFSPGCGSTGNYVTQWYKNVANQNAAKPVTVAAGANVTAINDALQTAGAITGKVTDTSATSISGICVSATSLDGQFTGYDTTAANGTYNITGLPAASYDVEFTPGCGATGNYATQWYNNVTTQGAATAVSVPAGTTVTGINDALQTLGAISGKVTDTSGTATPGICVSATSLDGQFFGSATTATNGTYDITGLAAASYDVEFTPGCGATGSYATQWYKNVSSQAAATPVNVTSGTTVKSINDALQTLGSISGKVTNASAAALSGICVDATSTDGQFFGSTSSVADGTYTVTGLPAGSYDVQFAPGCGSTGNYTTQWYNNVTTFSAATPVTVAFATNTPGINDVLQAGGSISGKVTDAATAAALSDVCVLATSPDGQLFGNDTTKANGTYKITGLAAAIYDVEFVPECGSVSIHATQWYDNVTTQAAATAVNITAGGSVTGINDTLPVLGAISGKVTNTAGTALAGICISAYSADGNFAGYGTTAVDGTYTTTGLPAGNYDVQFSPTCGATGNYATQWYNNVISKSAATAVSVSLTTTTTGINDALQPGGSISGKVTDASGTALAGICVFATSPDGQFVGDTTTSSKGTYKITDLDAASYDVEFLPYCGATGNYATQWYNNVSTQAAATAVNITTGGSVTGINDALQPGASISGKVTDASGTALSGICVSVYTVGSSVPEQAATTAGDGTYTVTGLSAASSDVQFAPGCGASGNYATQWYNNVTTQAAATSINVTAGASITGINDALQPGASISGKVTNASGTALGGICVNVYPIGSTIAEQGVSTGFDGTYTATGLAVGNYDVEFTGECGAVGSYTTQWYNNVTTQAAATAVSVPAGGSMTGINDALQPGP